MKSIGDVFKFWESLPEMAADVGESHWTVSKWKQRKRIPQTAWAAVVNGARRKGKHLTVEDLLAMHSPRRASSAATLACK